MKGVAMLLGVLLIASMVSAVQVNIPNVESSIFYDMEQKELVSGVTSKVLSVGDFDLRLGYTESEVWITSLSYDLKNLEKLGTEVNYLWGDNNLTLAFWCGHNFKKDDFTFGVHAVLIQLSIPDKD